MQESDHLAPIIPLFGAAKPARTTDAVGDDFEGGDIEGGDIEGGDIDGGDADSGDVRSGASRHGHTSGSADSGAAEPESAGGGWRSTWDTPIGRTGSGRPTSDAHAPGRDHPARGGAARRPVRLRALAGPGDDESSPETAPDVETVREAAEALLVRKLRSKSLSEAESRTILRGFDLDGQRLPAEQIDDVIDDFSRRGYLDDATLARLLVTSGVERKGQGRTALARLMAQRGIRRETIDLALDEVPDDDYERALEFARGKMRSLGRLDADTATRRLAGQLARRGYPGGVVSSVLKAVVAENYSARPTSGVRFE